MPQFLFWLLDTMIYLILIIWHVAPHSKQTVAFAAGIPGVVSGLVAKKFPQYMQQLYDKRLSTEIEKQRALNNRVRKHLLLVTTVCRVICL